MLDLQAVVQRIANAVRGVEQGNGAENEEIETDKGKADDIDGGRVLGGLEPAEGSGDSQDEQVDGDQESSDDTAGAEEDPEQRFDAKFGRLSVHILRFARVATR